MDWAWLPEMENHSSAESLTAHSELFPISPTVKAPALILFPGCPHPHCTSCSRSWEGAMLWFVNTGTRAHADTPTWKAQCHTLRATAYTCSLAALKCFSTVRSDRDVHKTTDRHDLTHSLHDLLLVLTRLHLTQASQLKRTWCFKPEVCVCVCRCEFDL